MRPVIAVILVTIVGAGLFVCLDTIPFGANHIPTSEKAGRHYITKAPGETGASNTVTSVVTIYRGLDTLGEVTILFIAALGLGSVLYRRSRKVSQLPCSASLVLRTACHFLFPLILILGAYVFIHGHLSPGGGFQGGVIAASGFLLVYIGCGEKKLSTKWFTATESVAGGFYVIVGLTGLALGGSFLMNFLPKGDFNTLFSAGTIPLIYSAIGFKVGAELAGIIAAMLERSE
jgi:multicomponent Na+:H+ antiporter subunit B